jgi:hypothetical protein
MGSFSLLHLAILGGLLLVPIALLAAGILAVVLILRATRK